MQDAERGDHGNEPETLQTLTLSRGPQDWERDAQIAPKPCFWQAWPGLLYRAFLGMEVRR